MDELERQFIEELHAIAQIRYRKGYDALCSDRQRVVLNLHRAGFLEDV